MRFLCVRIAPFKSKCTVFANENAVQLELTSVLFRTQEHRNQLMKPIWTLAVFSVHANAATVDLSSRIFKLREPAPRTYPDTELRMRAHTAEEIEVLRRAHRQHAKAISDYKACRGRSRPRLLVRLR